MRFTLTGIFIFISSYLFSQNEVIYIWSGALTSNSIKVNAKMTDSSSTVRLVVSNDSLFTIPLYSSFYHVDTATNYMVSMEVSFLNPLTKYYYCVESGGIMDSSADDVGSFTTFANGAFSYSFVLGSCALSSDHQVFDVMRSMLPSFYMNTGDLHYDNPNSATDINVHRHPYETVLSKARTAALFKKVPFVYIWDDHDFCGNDADSTAAGRENARIAYHEYVPHYPLAFGAGPSHAISQSFTVGRVHFILTDLRSVRNPDYLLGTPEQRAWFESECIYARDNHLIIAWVSTDSWSGTDPDNWGGYAAERVEISDFLVNNAISNLFFLCGDAHMLAIDNGNNADFSTGYVNPARYPIFQAAALNQNGSYKGGTYSEGGYFPNPLYTFGQFGLVNVNDSGGDSICISFKGYRVDSSSAASVSVLDSFNFCRNLNYNVSAVPEKKLSDDISIQPNPSEVLSVFSKEEIYLKALKVYSVTGALVYSENKINTHVTHYSITNTNFKTGCYIVQLETDKGVVKKYWVKH